ncbi:MAG: hypothetical protein ACTHP8_24255 [Bosea sp. (in: a-proteobacteria)]|uniref:hypothetical protein n=1 Tax=Bosea sp. (in: a-proteobacteria) TaxID=1871050 RepID=UPI003F7C646B
MTTSAAARRSGGSCVSGSEAMPKTLLPCSSASTISASWADQSFLLALPSMILAAGSFSCTKSWIGSIQASLGTRMIAASVAPAGRLCFGVQVWL